MNICRSCGSAVNTSFCPNCGTPATAAAASTCPRCNQSVAPNTSFCPSCGNQLAPQYGAPQQPYNQQPPFSPYANSPVQPQQQNNIGKYAMGALGGAAAVLGGEMLLHGFENGIERHVERDEFRREGWGGPFMEPPRHHHHHHHRRCFCGHEYGIDLDFCPRCRRRWGSW